MTPMPHRWTAAAAAAAAASASILALTSEGGGGAVSAFVPTRPSFQRSTTT
eukprot:CAMPEP_0113578420 /NCGR_PEP_ID=MMETSP0015_2-20120614/29476_1 /TAXON_ID=2838 /ORGANISM="Odontella" /LENGTH=50 /DNA_ID=CAMNT_0000482233 /DNA_START=297 /DNA_END=446 /DNA_ORIENTATION=+ /assembly_acc=CAM_ASM_000160